MDNIDWLSTALDITFLCLPRFRTLRCSVGSISSLWFHFRFTEKNTEKEKYVKRNYHTFEKNPRKIIPKLYDTLPTLCTVNGLINARGVYSHYSNNLNKTNMLSAKISREFKNSGTSTPSIDTFRPSRDPYRSFRSQLNIDVKTSRLRVIVWQSLFYPYFEISIEQDKIRCQSLVNQARNWKNWMIMLLVC